MINTSIKKIAWSIIGYSGLIDAIRYFNKDRITILYLHGVMDDKKPCSWVPLRPQLSPRQLDKSLSIISRYYRFISFDEAIDILKGVIPPISYAVVVTFDDGYRNNIKYALPVLKRYGIDPIIFLTAGNIENRVPFWFDRLDFALQHVPIESMEFKIDNKPVPMDFKDRSSLRSSFKYLRGCAKTLDRNDYAMQKEIDAISTELEKKSGQRLNDLFEEDDWSALLTWDEAMKVSEEGVSFGSHTIGHTRLRLVDDDSIRDELSISKAMIERRLKKPCRHLCYPNGSFDERSVTIARECGYDSAATTIPGLNKIGDDLFRLRRISFPSEDDETKVLAAMIGLSNWLDGIVASVKNKIYGIDKSE